MTCLTLWKLINCNEGGCYFMWIRTQNNRKLVWVIEVEIKPCTIRKGSNAYYILGRRIGDSMRNKIELGRYSTIEEAYIVLSDIQHHLNIESPMVYQMK